VQFYRVPTNPCPIFWGIVIETQSGVKQGNILAPTLFNLALEYVVRKSIVETTGSIWSKSVQIFAFADDVDMTARNIPTLSECYNSFKQSAKTVGLHINNEKTKYLSNRQSASRIFQISWIGDKSNQ